jgi:hypothetical protein
MSMPPDFDRNTLQGLTAIQGLTPLAIGCRPFGASFFSPEGATVNSQGCQPLAEEGWSWMAPSSSSPA